MFGTRAHRQIGDVVPFTKNGSDAIRIAAFNALGTMKAVDELTTIKAALSDSVPAVAQAACGALASMGDEATSAAPDVAKLLGSKDETLKTRALQFMKAAGSDVCKKYSKEICGCLDANDASVREAAIGLFGQLGADAKPLAKDAASYLGSKNTAAKCAA